MNDFETVDNIDNKSLVKTLIKVALPIALQSLIGSSLNIVDNLMVGSLGEVELNAVGISVQFFFIYWMICYGFLAGASTFIAKFFGANDMGNVKRSVGFAMTITSCIGIIFFLAGIFFPQYILRIFTNFPHVIQVGEGYIRIASFSFLMSAITMPMTMVLRVTQQTRIPLYASVAALLTNTALNYLFIFGNFGAPKMGVEGAALATSISRILETAIIMFIVFKRNNVLSGSIRDYLSYNRELAGKILKNAMPTTINETLWGLATSLYVAAYARIGITKGAVVQACNTINNLFYLVGFSMGDAILILLGARLGRNEIAQVYDLSKKLINIGIVLGMALGGIMIATGEPIIGLFNFSTEGAYYAKKILLIYGLILWVTIFNGMQIAGVLRSGGDTRFAMFVDLGGAWLIGVPMAFLSSLYLGLPVYLAVLCVKTEEIVKALFLIKRYLSKKWLKNIIR